MISIEKDKMVEFSDGDGFIITRTLTFDISRIYEDHFFPKGIESKNFKYIKYEGKTQIFIGDIVDIFLNKKVTRWLPNEVGVSFDNEGNIFHTALLERVETGLINGIKAELKNDKAKNH